MFSKPLSSSLAKHICESGKYKGIVRDCVLRYLISRDQFWWHDSASPWRMNEVHASTEPLRDELTGEIVKDPYKPSYWRDRVMDLCEWDITRQNFGLGYNELMNLDPATFEEIENRVFEIAKRQTESTKNLGNETKGVNILEGLKK